MFVVAEKIGGQVIGGFDGDTLVGYALSIPGSRDNHAYLHSHMLAVRESYRNSGLGKRLKLAQRQDALQRGFALIEWTFDPLEIKNAYLNIVKLGVIARKYSVNHYGYSSSPLHRGLPTDRLIVEWWLKSKRVTGLLDEGRTPGVNTVEIIPAKKIHVPAEIYAWRASAEDLPKAAHVLQRNRQEFIEAFSQGLAVTGYERDAAGNGTFLLGTWDENPDEYWNVKSKAEETR
ncbi:MAG: GNAT family N-acetyltransferase [Acidobacteriia bacterium]|nr:GNAT family N-acetyltransferase [Terriglobia bacterium]